MNKSRRNLMLIIAGVIVAASTATLLWREPPPSAGTAGRIQRGMAEVQRRPIIQILRTQPGLPSVADTVASLCPSMASVSFGKRGAAAPAFAISEDGWVMASGVPASGVGQILFADGTSAQVSEIRSDLVSGLSILDTGLSGLRPLALADQAFPRAGDFGVVVQAPAGSGCTAQAAMIASDFLADGKYSAAYIRLQPMGDDLPSGAPFLSGDGQIIGVVAANGPANSAIPAALVGDIIDELLRNSLTPTTQFGFRAKDFDTTLAARLSDGRSSGTTVALVEPKSPAARAGLRAGDIVLSVDGSPVASASELGRALDGAGNDAKIGILRANARQTLKIARIPGR